jgi:ABC-type transport system involved in multi-copper enzyme maturation permease subunit
MLWDKAWLESRARFLISAAALIGLCLALVFVQSTLRARLATTGAPLNTYAGYIHRVVYSGVARPLFAILALILGLGGLLREREQGTAAFTLALPVRRWRLVAARAAIGLVEVTAITLIPALVIPAVSPVVHQSYPFSQAIQFSVLWVAAGTILFATSFLLSTMLAGQYTAFLVAWILLVCHTLVAALRPLRIYRLNLNWMQSGAGMPYFDPRTGTLIGPLPWMRLSIVMLVSLILLAAAARITERQEY